MNKLLREYVKSCDTCVWSKAPRHRPFGLLQPLPIPSRPWGSIAMDFITDLPIVKAKNSILVVVDRLTKMAHFTPCSKSITVEDTTQLTLDGIVRLHGLPKEIVSDRGPQFASKFLRRLFELLKLTFGYLQLSTPRQMDKPNEQTRHWSNTFAALWTTNRTTSWTYYLKQNLLITTQRMHRPGSVHSLPITVFIPGLALKFLRTP
jgi:transposase InsO family protein